MQDQLFGYILLICIISILLWLAVYVNLIYILIILIENIWLQEMQFLVELHSATLLSDALSDWQNMAFIPSSTSKS